MFFLEVAGVRLREVAVRVTRASRATEGTRNVAGIFMNAARDLGSRRGRALIFWSNTCHHRPRAISPKSELLRQRVRTFGRLSFTHNGKSSHHESYRNSQVFNGAKGFDFITPEDGSKDVFVHASALESAGIRSLNEGEKVDGDRQA